MWQLAWRHQRWRSCLLASMVLALWFELASAARTQSQLLGTEQRGVVGDPWFCHDLDCPGYSVTRTIRDLELRFYSAGLWISTNTTGSYDTAVRVGFLKLFAYISGANERGWRIDMTSPMRTKVTATSSYCEEHFTVSFYLPDEYQEGKERPPAPSQDGLFLETTPAQHYWVVSYPGFTSEQTVVAKARAAMNKLANAGEAYDPHTYFSASYDPPFRLFNRHNEIWIASSWSGNQGGRAPSVEQQDAGASVGAGAGAGTA